MLIKIVPQLPYKAPFTYKFIHDLIRPVASDSIQLRLNIFNSFYRYIQFTVEQENDFSVPFLILKVTTTRKNTIILDWYQKYIASATFINYYSNDPEDQKYDLADLRDGYIAHHKSSS